MVVFRISIDINSGDLRNTYSFFFNLINMRKVDVTSLIKVPKHTEKTRNKQTRFLPSSWAKSRTEQLFKSFNVS